MKRDNKVLSLLGNLDIALAGLTLAVLIILTVLGVAWRYVFAQPFTWLEEVQLACMVWIVFAAGGAAFRTGNRVWAISRCSCAAGAPPPCWIFLMR